MATEYGRAASNGPSAEDELISGGRFYAHEKCAGGFYFVGDLFCGTVVGGPDRDAQSGNLRRLRLRALQHYFERQRFCAVGVGEPERRRRTGGIQLESLAGCSGRFHGILRDDEWWERRSVFVFV